LLLSYAFAWRLDGHFDLHVRLYPEGRFSQPLVESPRSGESLPIAGSFGDCVWQPPQSDFEPILMLAMGAGIAHLNALQ
jgi:NAD(P)H-flavin reductase